MFYLNVLFNEYIIYIYTLGGVLQFIDAVRKKETEIYC